MKRLFAEPLVQFLLLGLLLFGGQRLLGGDLLVGASDEPLVVDAQLAGWLASSEARTLGRTPTTGELEASIQRYARMEALRREARRLGLDVGDPIVERRLEQKMEFLLEGAAAEPTEDELAAWLREHEGDYAQAAIVSLEHRFYGDGEVELPFLGGPRARGTAEQLDARFGAGFGALVFAHEGEGWSERIGSAYGMHAVRIVERVPASAPELDAVRERVRRDLVAASAETERERRIDELVEALTVRVDADLAAIAAEASP
ncbi:MAG: peptidyl-prolyl cis-trans isomerase [Deltaproteobacteria bacterium]|nr:peptidyl-prolyl cis-trans isomerase [Deltaproteobacteria bacterium]